MASINPETVTKMETSESHGSLLKDPRRKRPNDKMLESGASKKSHTYEGKDYHVKLLISKVIAGAIIGKEGKSIVQLQKDTETRVKMSKNNEFYPGTNERVCLISGSFEGVRSAVVDYVLQLILEKADQSDGRFDHQDVQLKILTPNSTAGMIIGKGGSYVKQIQEESGAYVQLSQKTKESREQERIITINGDIDGVRKAFELVLEKIEADPSSASCLNLTYPEANMNGFQASFASAPSLSHNASSNFLNVMPGLNLNVNVTPCGSVANSALLQPYLEQIQVTLLENGYADHAISQILNAFNTLAKYGILSMGSNALSGLSAALNIGSVDRLSASSGNSFGAIGTRNTQDLSKSLDTFRSSLTHSGSPSNSFDHAESNEPVIKSEMEVAENLVGKILGPGGRSITEIQQQTGTNIQISKKGCYAPGTNNRIVTIQGSESKIAAAKYLIEARIVPVGIGRLN